MGYLELSKQELEKEYGNLAKRFEEIKGMGLNLNMARGKPSKEQLDFSLPMLDTINSKSDFIGEDKMDCRNYGLLNGITECRKLFADIFYLFHSILPAQHAAALHSLIAYTILPAGST